MKEMSVCHGMILKTIPEITARLITKILPSINNPLGIGGLPLAFLLLANKGDNSNYA